MNFSTPQKVTDTIRACDEVERVRALNRVKVNDLFNGAPPLTADKAKRWDLQVNVNWGEGPVLAANGRRQYENAFLGTQNFFRILIPDAPVEKKTSWELDITNFVNKILKESEDYTSLHEEKWTSVLSHGLGIQVYYDAESWCPDLVAIEDFRVPTDTKTNLKNLMWFAIRKTYTIAELSGKVFGKDADPGWNRPAVQKVLDDLKDINYENSEYTWMTSPEKMAELVKQNLGYYSSDAVPVIPLWHFYYLDAEDPTETCWYMCVVPDVEGGLHRIETEEFIYESKESIAKERAHLIHIQLGDLNCKVPFMVHSVRSLGFLLVEPCFWTNLARCRYLQHVFEGFNLWLRVNDPSGKARAQAIQLSNKAIIPEGVSIVPQTERHQIDRNLVESALAQLKQLMSEASQTYTQSTDTGTRREQTAFETRVKVEAVNAMMSGLLGRAFRREVFSYREICRRLCLRRTENKDARRFQEYCKRKGIPKQFVNVELWDIEPEIPLGSGNPTIAAATTQELAAIRPMCNPEAQQEILHEMVENITHDPRRAERWVPTGERKDVTDAQRDAEFAFGTLMQGVPVRMKMGLPPADQIETLLGLMAGVITRITKQTNLASPNELAGLQTVGVYIGQLLNQLASDPQQESKVRQFADALKNLANLVKGFMQRNAQMARQNGEGQPGIDPQALAKIQGSLMKAQSDAKIREAKSAQQLKHKEAAFILDQRREDAKAIAEQHREGLRFGGEQHRENLRAFNSGEESE